MTEIAGAVSANMAAFLRLHWAQMAAVRQFSDTLPPDEGRWYRALCGRCDAEVEAWGGKRFLDGYFAAAGRVRVRLFGVLAHSYLHAAYDFPRFLADSFPDFPELSRERRYRTYVLGTTQVWRTMLSLTGDSSIVGFAARLRLPGDRPFVRLVGEWFLAHRSVAWTTAEILAASDRRAELETRLLAGIGRAGRSMPGRWALPWLKALPFSCDLVRPETTETC